MREHLGSLTPEHQPVDAAPTMRRHDDQIAILQVGGPNDRFCRGTVDFVQEFNGDAMLGRSFLDRREERSHLFFDLLIKSDGRVVNATGNRGSRDLRQRTGKGRRPRPRRVTTPTPPCCHQRDEGASAASIARDAFA